MQNIAVFIRDGVDWKCIGVVDPEKVDVIEVGEEMAREYSAANVRIIVVDEVVDLSPD